MSSHDVVQPYTDEELAAERRALPVPGFVPPAMRNTIERLHATIDALKEDERKAGPCSACRRRPAKMLMGGRNAGRLCCQCAMDRIEAAEALIEKQCAPLRARVAQLEMALAEIADEGCDTKPYATNCDSRCKDIARTAILTAPTVAESRQ